MNNNELNFFASANSGQGFINYYVDIFENLKKHYIIKGGPGTGKSSLMKAVAKRAEEHNMTVEYFYCSSDPESLDGIIIKELSMGITDGTAPHTSDPRYPGVTDEIIDISRFWDRNILEHSKDSIIEIVNTKAKLYRDVYSYLSAALSLDRMIQREMIEIADVSALYALARSYAEVIPFRKGKKSVRMTDGITMKGHHTFTPYRNKADIIYNLKDSKGVGHLFLKHIKRLMTDNEIVVSYDALDPEKINMIYMPSDKILFCINSEDGEEIDMDDFISNDTVYKNNAKIRKTELLSDAYSILSEIERLHFSLEKIYISAMDFSRKEEFQEKLITEIFS